MTESSSDSPSSAPQGVAPSRARPFRRFIGIDLGGGRGKNTAIARLERGDGQPSLTVAEATVRQGHRGTGNHEGDALFRDEVLVDYLRRWTDDETVVAINAPLTLPPCVRCTLPCPGLTQCDVPSVAWMRRWAPLLLPRGKSDPTKPVVTPYTQRATEVLWTAVGARPREALGQGTGPLAARAAYLRRVLSPRLRLHENLLEVYPRATLTQLFGATTERRTRHGETERVWETRKEVLAGLREGIDYAYVWPEVVVRNTHVFGAVICAYTGFLWSHAGWAGPLDLEQVGTVAGVPVGDAARALGLAWVSDGWICAPPPPRAGAQTGPT